MTAELQHALALRELCCADFDRAQRWLQEAEVQIAPEAIYTASSISELEVSLQEKTDTISVTYILYVVSE